ncbi:MAG: HAD-IA family hydrolase [Candidatus Woesearchaeota archaeon]|nr:MAG: HAD-IA family hydrolase [Candidatus Woesearchaeota archaeon]
MIKAIVFDIGMVLLIEDRDTQYAALAKEFGYSLDSFYAIRAKYVDRCASGELSGVDYIRTIGKTLGIRDLDRYYEQWLFYCKANTRFDLDVKRLIERLKERYVLATLTNIIPPHQIIREQLNVYQDFQLKLFSYQEGLKKPDVRFYQLLIRTLHFAPEEILFIDDCKAYVDVALHLGMKAILFEDAVQLETDLRAGGINW